MARFPHVSAASLYIRQTLRHLSEALPYIGKRLLNMRKPLAKLSEALPHVSETLRHMSEALRHLSKALQHMSEGLRHMSEALQHMSEGLRNNEEPLRHMSEALRHLSKRLPDKGKRLPNMWNGATGRSDMDGKPRGSGKRAGCERIKSEVPALSELRFRPSFLRNISLRAKPRFRLPNDNSAEKRSKNGTFASANWKSLYHTLPLAGKIVSFLKIFSEVAARVLDTKLCQRTTSVV